jgi:hypothetical protein
MAKVAGTITEVEEFLFTGNDFKKVMDKFMNSKYTYGRQATKEETAEFDKKYPQISKQKA